MIQSEPRSGGLGPWLAAAVLLAVAVAFCSRAFAPGAVFVSMDVLYTEPPFAGLPHPPEYNPFLSDQATIYYPWLRYARERLAAGDFPLWTAESYGGVPFFGNLSTGLLFPLSWLHFLLPFHLSFTIVPIVKLWLAGVFMLLFLRRLRLGLGPALIGALAYQLSGFMVLWLQYALTHVACLMPALFWLGERWRESRRRRDLALLALAFALQFLAGHPESSLVACAALVLYLLVREGSVRGALRRLAAIVPAGVLAVALCAVQLFPFVEYLVRSEGQRLREGHHAFAGSMAQTLVMPGPLFLLGAVATAAAAALCLRRGRHLLGGLVLGATGWLLVKAGLTAQALVQLLPDLYGNPVGGGLYRGPYTYTDLNGGFVGVAALGLALIAVLRVRSSAVAGLALIALATFGAAQRIPGIHHAVKALPLFSLVAGTRFSLATAFALAALAAHGAAVLAAPLPWRRIGLVLAGTSASALLLALVLRAPPAAREHDGTQAIAFAASPPAGAVLETVRVDGGAIYSGAVLAPVPWIGSERFEEGDYQLEVEFALADGTHERRPAERIRIRRPKTLSRGDLASGGAALAALALAVLLARRGHARLAGAVLFAVILGEEARFGFFYNAVTPEARVFPQTRTTTYLEERARRDPPFRVLTEKKILPPNLHLPYHWSHVRGYDAMENRAYMAVIRHLFRTGEVPWIEWGADTMQYQSPLFDLLGVRFILSTQDLSSIPKLVRVLDADGLGVWENTAVSPRAFVTGAAVDIESPERTAVDPRTHAILERPPALGGSGRAQVAHYESDELDVDVEVDGEAVLIVTDNYFPGWHALVDGEEREVLRTHGTFRAVRVRQGDHRVHFVYRPASVIGGAALSAVALLVWLVLLIRGGARRA